MRAVLVICLVFALAATAPAPPEDIDVILKMDPAPLLTDEAKWKEFYNCLMETGPCNDLHQQVKDKLPKILASSEKYNAEKKAKLDELLKQFALKHPDDYIALKAKLLPESD